MYECKMKWNKLLMVDFKSLLLMQKVMVHIMLNIDSYNSCLYIKHM